jgi:acyl carrier protein
MSKVSFEEFAKEFASDLDIEGDEYITANLKDVPQYDSMGKINVSLTIEKLFGFQIAYEVLDKADTIRSIYEYACNKENGD